MPDPVPHVAASEPPRRSGGKSLPTLVSELWDLTVTYLKQETVTPIKGLVRYVALGIAGSVFVSIGVVLLVLAALRALQTETGDTFEDSWSWAPYLLTVIGCAVVLALSLRAISAGRRRPKKGKV